MWHKSFTSLKQILIYSLLMAAMPVHAVQIREVPAFYLRDASIATYDQYGPIIYYNPQTLYKLGPQISQFVRAHEYAHHILNHIRRGESFTRNKDVAEMRRSYELEADCYAAKNVSRQIAIAAADNFSRTQGKKRPDTYHPSGNERAGMIRQCAGISS